MLFLPIDKREISPILASSVVTLEKLLNVGEELVVVFRRRLVSEWVPVDAYGYWIPGRRVCWMGYDSAVQAAAAGSGVVRVSFR